MTNPNIAVRLIVSAAVLLGLALTGSGLVKLVHFERTPTAIANARTGSTLLLLGCTILIVCAAVVLTTGPRWATLAIAAPAIICGGLALTASGTLLPQIAALPTFTLALAGITGVLIHTGPP